jgi:prepilin-type N-terminal cleavage/methylation domain-containing protein
MSKTSKAFTLIEMAVAMLIVSLLTFGAGTLLAGGQRNWNVLYGRVYGDPAVDGFLVQRVFDSVCRKASLRKCVLSENRDSLEVYYWDEASIAETPENYARIYLEDSEVYVEHGKLCIGSWDVDSQAESTTMRIAQQVSSLAFELKDKAVRMYLTYEDEKILPVISSAVRHNK